MGAGRGERMHLIHATDLHLDHVCDSPVEAAACAAAILRDVPEGPLVLTGDIACGTTFPRLLPAFAEATGRDVFFVLGNHDAYGTGIRASREAAARLARKRGRLHFLPSDGPALLTEKTVIVGVNGWWDMRAGDVNGTGVTLTDFSAVEELRGLHRDRRREVVGAVARRDAARLMHLLAGDEVADTAHIIVATHVPPFPEASMAPHGERSGPSHLPYYCNLTLGQKLLSYAEEHAEQTVTVLCGHTHTAADVLIAGNLRVIVGAARYGAPAVAGVHEVP